MNDGLMPTMSPSPCEFDTLSNLMKQRNGREVPSLQVPSTYVSFLGGCYTDSEACAFGFHGESTMFQTWLLVKVLKFEPTAKNSRVEDFTKILSSISFSALPAPSKFVSDMWHPIDGKGSLDVILTSHFITSSDMEATLEMTPLQSRFHLWLHSFPSHLASNVFVTFLLLNQS
jgi:hypothetical protein